MNTKANNKARVGIRGRWHTGTAAVLRDDDPHARLTKFSRTNSSMVRAFGTDLLTLRIALD
jgi:hypothetical protein